MPPPAAPVPLTSSPASHDSSKATSDSTTWRPRLPLLVSLGNFFFKSRDLLVPIVFVALIVIFKPRPMVGRLYWPDYAAGIALILAGLALRAAVVGFAYIKR